MQDGSICKRPEGDTRDHTLHKVKEKGENELVLDRIGRVIKENV